MRWIDATSAVWVRGAKRGWIRAATFLLVALAASNNGVALAAHAGCAFSHGIRPQDTIFVVNVRSMGACCDPGLMEGRMGVETCAASDESGGPHWMPADLDALRSGDPSVSTVIYVHGNRITAWDAKCEGLWLYRRMIRENPDAPPFRFVVFSWPASQIPGPLKDVRAKAARTGPAGCQLAWFVDQLPPETPITYVGFSFGARIITGALHIQGGGSLGRCGVELQHSHRAPANVVLIAAALHADWLCPGHYHGQAMSQVNQMLLVNNCEDLAMKYYRFVSTSGRPQALGCCGPTCIDPEGAAKITQRNVSRYVGREHDLMCYFSAPGVIGQIWEYAAAPTAGL